MNSGSTLTVWASDCWQLQKGMPLGLSAIAQNQTEPVAEIAVYATTVRWSEVEAPEGLDVIDNRMVAHGFQRSARPILLLIEEDIATLRCPKSGTVTEISMRDLVNGSG